MPVPAAAIMLGSRAVGPALALMKKPVKRRYHIPSPGRRTSCCFGINTGFLKTHIGWMKMAELVLGSICEYLLFHYCSGFANLIRDTCAGFMTTSASCLFTTTLLFFTYLISSRSYSLIRSSLLEIFFGVTAACLYLASSTSLLVMSCLVVWPTETVLPVFNSFPALYTASSTGFIVAIVYASDVYCCIRERF